MPIFVFEVKLIVLKQVSKKYGYNRFMSLFSSKTKGKGHIITSFRLETTIRYVYKNRKGFNESRYSSVSKH